MAIDDAELRHLLTLARLDLEPSVVERVKHDLNRVLEYVDTLSELDTDGVEPLVRPLEVPDALRADDAVAPLARDSALALGRPDEAGRFVVPRTVDEGN